MRVTVGARDAELAADALWAVGCHAVAEETLPDGRVRLVADVADVALLPAHWPVEVIETDDRADLDAWRAHARPELAGQGFVLVPAWWEAPDETPAQPDTGQPRRSVVLEPGRTFGSGSHPTTRLCVAAMERLVRPGAHVLDLGCGSGVLTVVAALLGADSITALDVDPDAVEVTVDNARRNGVADRVRASTTPIDEVAGRFDLVVANIGVRVLTERARSISGAIAPGGHLILSGLLAHQVAETVACYEPFAPLDQLAEDGWCAVSLRREDTAEMSGDPTGR